jgi:hypothetical protein
MTICLCKEGQLSRLRDCELKQLGIGLDSCLFLKGNHPKSQTTKTLLKMENGISPHVIRVFEDNLTSLQDLFEFWLPRTGSKTLTIAVQ